MLSGDAIRIDAVRLCLGLVDVAPESPELFHLDLHLLAAGWTMVNHWFAIRLGCHTPR